MLLSRKSGPDIEIFPFPGALAEIQLAVELLKAPLQGLDLAPLSSGGGILSGQFFQIFPNKPVSVVRRSAWCPGQSPASGVP
jgi:hypothetical protein